MASSVLLQLALLICCTCAAHAYGNGEKNGEYKYYNGDGYYRDFDNYGYRNGYGNGFGDRFKYGNGYGNGFGNGFGGFGFPYGGFGGFGGFPPFGGYHHPGWGPHTEYMDGAPYLR